MIVINKTVTPFKVTITSLPNHEYHFSSIEGLTQWAIEKSSRPNLGECVAREALSWVNEDEVFNPAVPAQCCIFARRVFKDCGIKLGITKNPSDKIGPPKYPLGEGHSNSLAGNDIGEKLLFKNLQPGDLVFFKNTYGDWPEGTITHIGIYTGAGYFVHRPTKSGTVKKTLFSEYYGGKKFVEGRRVSELLKSA